MDSENFLRFDSSDGKLFISSAREAISMFLATRKIKFSQALLNDTRFEKKHGCFVTLRLHNDERTLRGCIGFPEPVYELSKALILASVSAATEDPRFPPIKEGSEFDQITVEVSVLTIPQVIQVKSPRDFPAAINVGRDGLIMRWSFGSGLLLPQVASEEHWRPEDFLSNLSMKAGAPPDQWLVQGTQILKFQAQIFEELIPRGEISLK